MLHNDHLLLLFRVQFFLPESLRSGRRRIAYLLVLGRLVCHLCVEPALEDRCAALIILLGQDVQVLVR